MKFASCYVAAAAAFRACQAAQTPGTLKFDIARSSSEQSLSKRGSTSKAVATDVYNAKKAGKYFVNVTIGSPPQIISLHLDTGSSDTWVPASNTSACSQAANCELGSYNVTASSSAEEYAPGKFHVQYGDGTTASGDYITDDLQLGEASISELVVAVAYDFNTTSGLMGVGYPLLESIVTNAPAEGASLSQAQSLQYSNLPKALAEQNITNTIAFSLWLNDLDASTGNILFGGIDTSKYKGDLTLLDVVPSSISDNTTTIVYYNNYNVMLSGMKAVSDSGSDILGSSSFPMPVLLDSGSTEIHLPKDLLTEIYAEVNATFSDEFGVGAIDCNMAQSKGYFSFEFGGPGGATVDVSMSELVLTYQEEDGLCEFAVVPSETGSGGHVILGDVFLRSAYVVYDQSNNQVAIAQTNFNATDANIVTFASLGAPVPSATLAPDSTNVSALNKTAVTATATSLSAASGFAVSPSASGAVASSSANNLLVGCLGFSVFTLAAVAGGFAMILF